MTIERSLMIARMNPADASEVARLFASTDVGDLPRRMGVRHRALFRLHDVYAHLIEAEAGLGERIRDARRDDPEFCELSAAVDHLVNPWDPEHWTGPLDSRATQFYRWTAL
ncbi:MAG: TcmI family type II polyketide cyclase [Geodermatophilaceae bacterium]